MIRHLAHTVELYDAASSPITLKMQRSLDVHDHDGSLGKDDCTWIILASFVATGGIGRSVEQLGLWSLVEGSLLRIYNERCSLFNDAAKK